MQWQETQDFANHLRKASTAAGHLMWQLVRNRQRCGAKFRREYVQEPFILDFYCPETKLCIECDGLPHFTAEGIERDKRRTAWLNSKGIHVIRFTSHEIENETARVIEEIESTIGRLRQGELNSCTRND